jgi:hypothetical protein
MLESDEDKMLRLAQSLTRQTRSGAIEWERRDIAPRDPDILRFEYSTSRSTITVDNSGGDRDDWQGWIVMTVRNSEGAVVAAVEVTRNTVPEFDVILEDLFDAARRQVFDVDKTLDALIAEVEDLEPPF